MTLAAAVILQVQELLKPAGQRAAAVLEAAPQLLDPSALRAVLAELAHLFGSARDPAVLLGSNPGLALACQSLQHQERGGRDAEYVADAFGARCASDKSGDGDGRIGDGTSS